MSEKGHVIRKMIITMMSLLMLILIAQSTYAQRADLQYFRAQDKTGVNVFETSKTDSVVYKGMDLRIGGGFAMQGTRWSPIWIGRPRGVGGGFPFKRRRGQRWA